MAGSFSLSRNGTCPPHHTPINFAILFAMTAQILEADLADPQHAAAIIALLDGYARTPFGQSRPLSDDVQAALIPALRKHPTTRIFLAQRDGQYVGIAVCFVGFSTFVAKPLLNIHDIYVRDDQRSQGIGSLLLEAVTQAAIASGYCKLTLEVADANTKATAVYLRAGFEMGTVGHDANRFLNKKLK